MKYKWKVKLPIGEVVLGETDGKLSHLLFEDDKRVQDYEWKETKLLQETKKQLNQFFNGERKDFDLPIVFIGTEFQKAVWTALETIPYGETRSYKDIAHQVGNEKAVRAVGMTNGKNPISIIVPCHRVIGANGKLTGYAGGLKTKEFLLDLEKEK